MTDQDQETVTVPKGDPVFSIYIWRQDSITLTRLRPVLEELDQLGTTPCSEWGPGDSCWQHDGTETCLACELRRLRAVMHQVI